MDIPWTIWQSEKTEKEKVAKFSDFVFFPLAANEKLNKLQLVSRQHLLRGKGELLEEEEDEAVSLSLPSTWRHSKHKLYVFIFQFSTRRKLFRFDSNFSHTVLLCPLRFIMRPNNVVQLCVVEQIFEWISMTKTLAKLSYFYILRMTPEED